MIGRVKIDKLRVGYKNSSEEIANKIEEVLESYYERYSISKEANQLTISVTPTKQLRDYYDGYNHNLQMIPLDQFLEFLKDLRKAAGEDLTIYLQHLAKDVLMYKKVDKYLDNLLNHEYLNGYVASNTASSVSEEDDNEDDSWRSFETVYISKKKELDSGTPQKLVIKFYNKAIELMTNNKSDNESDNKSKLKLKEPDYNPELPTYCEGNTMYLELNKINLMRCEIELKENKLPFRTIDEMIEAIENGTFQVILESKFDEIMNKVIFAEFQNLSCKSVKEIAVNLISHSNRNYKLLFVNAGMRREYNYFKKSKEAKIRKSDPLFNELREKLVSTSSEAS